MLAVGEFFVRAQSARSQARSACVIARVSIRPKVLLAVGKFHKNANIYFSSSLYIALSLRAKEWFVGRMG